MSQNPLNPSENRKFSDLLSPDGLRLLSGSGSEFIRELGLEVVRGVVLDVMTGKNLRDSTEMLTRRRIAALNLATVNLFLKGAAGSADFIAQLPYLAAQTLIQPKLSKSEKWIAQWLLGLTDKSVQNVLRDSHKGLSEYRDRYIEVCRQVVMGHSENYGHLSGLLQLSPGQQAEQENLPATEVEINWLFLTYLLNAIGAQTLTVRGSEKSAYGKLFEKLILGSLLHILGFSYVAPLTPGKGVYWLSSREDKRESDATLLYELGKGIRFDIGFIGRGNSEISLDKVSRYEQEASYGATTHYLATFIVVDRIGKGSRIVKLANDINGTIIQMSAGYWPQQVALVMKEKIGFEHPLSRLPENEIEAYLRFKLSQVPLEDFTRQVRAEDLISDTAQIPRTKE